MPLNRTHTIMQRALLSSALLLLMLITAPLNAALVEDLFTVELPVPDQTTSQRLDTFSQALKLVLVKVGGSSEALADPRLARPLKSSSRYVQQFRYVVRKDAAAEEFDSGQMFLRVVFNQELVENLLRENDISVWGKERPSTLLLISFDVNKKASLVSSDTTSELVEELDDITHKHGLPVLFPLLDLEDRLTLGIQDVIDSNDENIDALAARYTPDSVMSGQLIGRVGRGWRGVWQLRFADQLFRWEFQAASRQDVLNQAIDQLAKTLASEYALESYLAFEQDVLFSVDQVSLIGDHIKVLAYLQSLDAIEAARLVLVEDDKVTYRVKLRNTADDLHRLINLGYVLEQLDLPQINAATDDQTVLMSYRFLN